MPSYKLLWEHAKDENERLRSMIAAGPDRFFALEQKVAELEKTIAMVQDIAVTTTGVTYGMLTREKERVDTASH